MQNGSLKTGRGITINGTLVSTPKRQPKSTCSRQERGSCSSTASCPVFSVRQSNNDPPPRCPSSLSLPTLHGSASVSSLSCIKGSVFSLKSFQSSNLSLHSCSPMTGLRSSSSSQRSSSSSSSEDDSWDTNSWSSGATCLLRSSIKQHSEEVFRAHAGSGGRPEGTSDSETDGHRGSAVGSASRERADWVAVNRRDSERSLTSSHGTSSASTTSAELEEKIEAKLKFSHFLDEVTSRVLDPECLQAFYAVRQREAPVACPQTSLTLVSTPHFSMDGSWSSSSRDSWVKCMPSCKILDSSKTLRRKQEELPFMELSCRAYLETDIDQVGREHEISPTPITETEMQTLQSRGDMSRRIPDSKRNPVLKRSDGAPRPPHRSTSLPRPLSNNTATDVEDVCGDSSVQEQKDDLRRRLNYTTHKLHMLEKEFDSSRQYQEKELRRTQEELQKYTERLHRIQSSYTALQRINQELQDKIQQMTKLHEHELRSLSREILVLNNHLIDANITIHRLREDHDLYKRDSNLTARLLQHEKSPHMPAELPADFQRRVSSHMEKRVHERNAAPSEELEKEESGRRCPVTPSSSPQSRDFMSSGGDGGDKLQQRKSCDLYRSDTALYCREERWPERRQSTDLQNSTEDVTFHLSFSPFREFTADSHPVTGAYSCFIAASEKKMNHLTSSQPVWCEGDYECKNSFSYEKDSSTFARSNQHVSHGSQSISFPASYRLAEDEPMDCWRRMSVEDMKTFSLHRSAHISPFRCSEQHFTTQPTKIKLSSFCNSMQDRDDVFHTHVLNPCFSGSSPALNPKTSPNVFCAETDLAFGCKDGCQNRFLLSGNSKDEQQIEESLQQDDIDESRKSSNALQWYKKDLQSAEVQKNPQKHIKQCGNTRLSRKDSLTKAQLYGTLLN